MGRNDVACEGFYSRTHSVVQLVTRVLGKVDHSGLAEWLNTLSLL